MLNMAHQMRLSLWWFDPFKDLESSGRNLLSYRLKRIEELSFWVEPCVRLVRFWTIGNNFSSLKAHLGLGAFSEWLLWSRITWIQAEQHPASESSPARLLSLTSGLLPYESLQATNVKELFYCAPLVPVQYNCTTLSNIPHIVAGRLVLSTRATKRS